MIGYRRGLGPYELVVMFGIVIGFPILYYTLMVSYYHIDKVYYIGLLVGVGWLQVAIWQIPTHLERKVCVLHNLWHPHWLETLSIIRTYFCVCKDCVICVNLQKKNWTKYTIIIVVDKKKASWVFVEWSNQEGHLFV